MPVTGDRPAALLQPRPQGRVQRHTVDHVFDVLPVDGEPTGGGLQAFDSHFPEQAFDVPKISEDRIQQRLVDRDLRPAQMAE